MQEIKLLPCPACGGEANIIDQYERDNKGHVAIGWSAYCTRGCLITGEHGSREKAAQAWNTLPRALTWTKEPPKEQGWYWCRDYGKYIHIVHVGVDLSEYQEIRDVEWAGPISEPREAEHD